MTDDNIAVDVSFDDRAAWFAEGAAAGLWAGVTGAFALAAGVLAAATSDIGIATAALLLGVGTVVQSRRMCRRERGLRRGRL